MLGTVKKKLRAALRLQLQLPCAPERDMRNDCKRCRIGCLFAWHAMSCHAMSCNVMSWKACTGRSLKVRRNDPQHVMPVRASFVRSYPCQRPRPINSPSSTTMVSTSPLHPRCHRQRQQDHLCPSHLPSTTKPLVSIGKKTGPARGGPNDRNGHQVPGLCLPP